MMDEDLYWYWLNNIPTFGRKTIRALLDIYKSPKNLYEMEDHELNRIHLKNNQIKAYKESKNLEIIRDSYNKLLEDHIKFLHPRMKSYPNRLKNIPDCPLGLYLKGKLFEDSKKSIAIIGARNCTQYGKEMARYFGKELAKRNIVVISGLARGVDAFAHSGVLENKGYTLGVIGGGIDHIYPKENYNLYMQLEENGGILSENNIGVKPYAGLFPERNRLISGLADAILVIEAMEKSGTLITVDQGLEQGKDILALPGKILDRHSAGCNNLIKQGAYIVTDIQDILDVLQISDECIRNTEKDFNYLERVNQMSLAPQEKMVYSCLRIEPKYIEEILMEMKIPPQELINIIYHLILKGLIEEPVPNYYAIKL